MEGLKQFSLEEYLKNPSRPVVSRDGNPVEIIKTDLNGFPSGDDEDDKDVIVAVESYRSGYQICNSYRVDGRYNNEASDRDLFFKPIVHEYWAVMDVEADAIIFGGNLFAYKEDAEAHLNDDRRVVKVIWEE